MKRAKNKLARQWLGVFILSLLLYETSVAANYPLKVSSTNPHILVDQSNVPFLIHGDCAWALMVTPNQAEAEEYLENRRQKGFNTVVVMLIASHSSINNGDTANRYGVEPFTSLYDLTMPNEPYFTNADWVIDRAAQKGIQVLLAPCYVGFDPGQGWQNVMVANGTDNCRSYGRFLGQRYKDKPNIIWLHSGDNGDTNYFPYIREIALGIREFDANHLQTAKLWPEQSARDPLSGESWLDFNTTYAYGIAGFFDRRVYDKTLEDYNTSPAMASFLVESRFENEQGADAYRVRRQAYWSVLSGSSGQVMGHGDIWPFHNAPFDNAPWQAAMDGAGSVSMSYLKKLFDSRPWYAMASDQDHTVVTDGYGAFDTDDYLTAMRATDGSTIICYVPTSRTFTVEMTKVSGVQVKAWWYDPRDGTATHFATYANTGSQSFTPPDANDWILVLDDASYPFGAPGTATAPTISDIPFQFITVNAATPALPFTINDPDTPVGNLTLNGNSSNPTLVPSNNIMFGGSGNDRTVTVTPAAGQTGTAVITVTVSDGPNSADERFLLGVRTPAILLEVPQQTAEQIIQSGFRFLVTADSPGTFTIECTTNATSWQPIGTLQYTNGQAEFIDSDSKSSPTRLYRVRVP